MIDLTLDFHAHILPGCDHGCNNTETALWQLREAWSAGIRTVAATPHFYPHQESAEAFLRRRDRAFQRLQEVIAEDIKTASEPDDFPHIIPGAEVLICEGLERMEELPLLCRTGTNELLLEMPFYEWSRGIRDTLYELLDRRDIRVVMAHVDRYPHEDILDLIKEGVYVQLNAECFRKMGARRRRFLSWVSQGYVQYLGSDIHMHGEHYKDYAKAAALIRKQTS